MKASKDFLFSVEGCLENESNIRKHIAGSVRVARTLGYRGRIYVTRHEFKIPIKWDSGTILYDRVRYEGRATSG